MKYIVGVDEAGRGPLAGPVSVGVAIMEALKSKRFLRGIKDSKKLSPEERELWFELASEAEKRGELFFAVSLVSERIIDKHGISYAIRLGVKRCLERLSVDADEQIFLDGGLKAPDKYRHQTTVVRGDEKIPIISLASIMAKVVRDRRMKRLAKKYPKYGFEKHKGYGTKAHIKAIEKFGPVYPHRKTFL